MATTLRDKTTQPTNRPVLQSSHEAEESDRLDWDVVLLTPPDKPTGKLQVRLSFQGRSKPPVLAMPEESDTESNE
ncbi:MAG: hypothetical protein OHK0029_24390 [Armatimonadaceae bacterium]